MWCALPPCSSEQSPSYGRTRPQPVVRPPCANPPRRKSATTGGRHHVSMRRFAPTLPFRPKDSCSMRIGSRKKLFPGAGRGRRFSFSGPGIVEPGKVVRRTRKPGPGVGVRLTTLPSEINTKVGAHPDKAGRPPAEAEARSCRGGFTHDGRTTLRGPPLRFGHHTS